MPQLGPALKSRQPVDASTRELMQQLRATYITVAERGGGRGERSEHFRAALFSHRTQAQTLEREAEIPFVFSFFFFFFLYV